MGHNFGTFLQVLALASHWLEDCANCTPMAQENDQYSADRSKCNTTASQFTFINAQLYFTFDKRVMTKKAASNIKPMQTRIHWKKYVNGSVIQRDM